MIVDGNEADTHEGEYLLQVASRINVVSGETGKVFADDTVDFLCLDVLHHLLEAGAVKVNARVAVIDVLMNDNEIVPLLNEVTNHFFLTCN